VIGAIETEYKGYRFRSRLEARWAVFFDTLGVEWKYETEGYEIDTCRYLPDFWLPGCEAWVEVKGDKEGLRKDFNRMRAVLGPASPLPGFASGAKGLIVLGDIPAEVPYKSTILHPRLTRASGILQRGWGFFIKGSSGCTRFVSDGQQTALSMLFGKYAWVDPSESAESAAWDIDSWILDTPTHLQEAHDAYKAARQARFEHGANGR
jgi:hypothetical protein